jgi:integrase
MPKQNRIKTKYPGVYYIETLIDGNPKKNDQIFYIIYRNRDGKLIEEKAGRKSKDDMTAARANTLRGERVRGEKSNKERREAKKAEKAAVEDRWTFDRLLKEYKSVHASSTSLPGEIKQYNIHTAPIFGSKTPHDLTSFEIEKFRTALEMTPKRKGGTVSGSGDEKTTPKRKGSSKSKGDVPMEDNPKPATLSPQTVKNILEFLRRLSNFGVNRDFYPPPPFRVEMPEVDNLKTERMTEEQMERYIRACLVDDDQVVASLLLVALYTGGRKESLRTLTWDRVDFEKETIMLFVKGRRTESVPMNTATHEVLEKLFNRKTENQTLVFPSPSGEGPVDVYDTARRIRDKVGLGKDFRPCHGLRHTFASDLASKGVGDLTIASLLTHSRKSGTDLVKRYAVIRPDAARKASDVISRFSPSALEQRAGETEVSAKSLEPTMDFGAGI